MIAPTQTTKRLLASLGLAAALAFVGAPIAQAQHGHGLEQGQEAAEEFGYELHEEEVEGHPAGHEVTLSAIFGDFKFLGSVVNFLVFAFLLYYFGKKPINDALARRRKDIEESLAEAQKLKAEAEAKRDEYKARLEKLDSEMEQIRADMIRAGESERDRIVKEAEHKAALLRKDSKFQIDQQFKQLRDDLTRETVEAAIAAAEEILSAQVQEQDQVRLGEQYLEAIAQQTKSKNERGVA